MAKALRKIMFMAALMALAALSSVVYLAFNPPESRVVNVLYAQTELGEMAVAADAVVVGRVTGVRPRLTFSNWGRQWSVVSDVRLDVSDWVRNQQHLKGHELMVSFPLGRWGGLETSFMRMVLPSVGDRLLVFAVKRGHHYELAAGEPGVFRVDGAEKVKVTDLHQGIISDVFADATAVSQAVKIISEAAETEAGKTSLYTNEELHFSVKVPSEDKIAEVSGNSVTFKRNPEDHWEFQVSSMPTDFTSGEAWLKSERQSDGMTIGYRPLSSWVNDAVMAEEFVVIDAVGQTPILGKTLLAAKVGHGNLLRLDFSDLYKVNETIQVDKARMKLIQSLEALE